MNSLPLKNERTEYISCMGVDCENEHTSPMHIVQRGTYAHGWRKYLLSVGEEVFEATAVKQEGGWSVGLSSQIGCPIGCTFCATGKGGFHRSLSSTELASQLELLACDVSGLITEIRFDAQGEPLLNIDAVDKVVALLSERASVQDSCTRNTKLASNLQLVISTCGVPAGIKRMLDWQIDCRLQVTVHTLEQALRSCLMPGTVSWPIADLTSALETWSHANPDTLQLEWGLLSGVNDGEKDMLSLARFAKQTGACVRLGVLTEVDDIEQPTARTVASHHKATLSPLEQLLRAKTTLEDAGVSVTIHEPFSQNPISMKWYRNKVS